MPPEAHPVVAAAAAGTLPSWHVAGRRRRAHMRRVADLLGGWARQMGVGEAEESRWHAAGLLHDALRGASPAELREVLKLAAGATDGRATATADLAEPKSGWSRFLPRSPGELPPGAWHGPAAAVALREDGVEDWELLHAISWHTLGSRRFGLLGGALFAADFLDPGRGDPTGVRRALRERVPRDPTRVIPEVVRTKLDYLSRAGRSVHPQTARFLDFLADGWQGDVTVRAASGPSRPAND